MSKRIKAFDTSFVGITTTVLDSRAWKAMSPHARIVYLAIKRSYNHKANNNGRLYLAGRSGSEQTGFSQNRVWKSIHELIHYGFAVVTKGAALGVDGKGRPTYLRLTEMGTRAEPAPTRDFLKWNGVYFSAGLTHGSRNLPKRPTDDQDGNGTPGMKFAKKVIPPHPVRQGAPCGEAPTPHAVRHPNSKVPHRVRHKDAGSAPRGEAYLVSTTWAARAGSRGKTNGSPRPEKPDRLSELGSPHRDGPKPVAQSQPAPAGRRQQAPVAQFGVWGTYVPPPTKGRFDGLITEGPLAGGDPAQACHR